MESKDDGATTDAGDAAAALSAMRESRERLAQAANSPPERHLAFAGLLGGMVATQAAPPLWAIGIEGLLLLAVGLVVAWDRRRTGMFVDGYRAGRTRPLTFGLLGFTVATLAICLWLKQDQRIFWAPLAGGLVVAVVAYGASAIWQRIFLRELRETP